MNITIHDPVLWRDMQIDSDVPPYSKSPNGTHFKDPEDAKHSTMLVPCIPPHGFHPWTGAPEEEPEETLRCWCHERASISQRCCLQSRLSICESWVSPPARPYIEDSPKYSVLHTAIPDGPSRGDRSAVAVSGPAYNAAYRSGSSTHRNALTTVRSYKDRRCKVGSEVPESLPGTISSGMQRHESTRRLGPWDMYSS
ncbi:hypothetical protein NA56DRAFT_689761 [Hyaloscypha hepaticicola]|uniref:Uncharacterized protein n=1 Tax=Hyaloscypha hepaticicola TaxID=2082293 RepID=A0A2J6Q1W6_9HELO|nr:hypothetical protein NA56DRAFT_689761 [Hyaloscypha hepaticicola]